MVLKLAILEEEPVEACIRKLATGVRDTRMEMVQVQLELNLQYRAPVEGSTFDITRGKGTMGGHCHRSSCDSGECSSRLHIVV